MKSFPLQLPPLERCHCGQPLHYTDFDVEQMVRDLVTQLGRNVRVTINGRTWLVPRHYIALHGLKAEEIPHLGFLEIQ